LSICDPKALLSSLEPFALLLKGSIDSGNSRKIILPKLATQSSRKVSKQADLGNSLSFSTLLGHILGVAILASKLWQDLKIGKASLGQKLC
jgi:hypothetical protein